MAQFTSSTMLGSPLRARTDALVTLFARVALTRMAGVPILNPALRVEAFGFEVCEAMATPAASPSPKMAHALEEPGAVGVLVTPWFMNLVWFPLKRSDQAHGVGTSHTRRVGAECFDFITGYEPGFGRYDACSLFSPMFEFANPAAAGATALAVLDTLRQPVPAALVIQAPVTTPSSVPSQPSGQAARRAFLLGRRSSAEQSA